MENKKDQEYITHIEVELLQSRLRSDMKREIRMVDDNLNSKIEVVDDKIDALREVVLPMAESSKQTANNTQRIAESMDRFTEEQRQTNGKFYDKLHTHELKFSGIDGKFADVGGRLDAQSESKKNNTTFWVAMIGFMGIVISGIFQLAPNFFN